MTSRVKLDARFIGDGYIYLWKTEIPGKAHFKQSTFLGSPLSMSNLRKMAEGYIPELKMEGQIHQFILSRMSGQFSLREIADQLVEKFPDQFKDWRQALTCAGELSTKYA